MYGRVRTVTTLLVALRQRARNFVVTFGPAAASQAPRLVVSVCVSTRQPYPPHSDISSWMLWPGWLLVSRPKRRTVFVALTADGRAEIEIGGAAAPSGAASARPPRTAAPAMP